MKSADKSGALQALHAFRGASPLAHTGFDTAQQIAERSPLRLRLDRIYLKPYPSFGKAECGNRSAEQNANYPKFGS
ncbi:MAG: hypothetical protein HY735_28490 [Verrucomicrobia bacterium]|nr:hypothetical protein [Verrucomicrobiota bacterium]